MLRYLLRRFHCRHAPSPPYPCLGCGITLLRTEGTCLLCADCAHNDQEN